MTADYRDARLIAQGTLLMHGTVVVQAATSAGGGTSPPAAMPGTGGGGTATKVVGLPRTGGAATTNRENTTRQLSLAGLLGLVLILAGLGVRRRTMMAPVDTIRK